MLRTGSGLASEIYFTNSKRIAVRLHGMEHDKLLSTSEARAYLADRGLKRAGSTWEHWVQQRTGPPYRKDASRYRYYSTVDLDRWMEKRLSPAEQPTKRKRKKGNHHGQESRQR
jgi:hypothetical protein